MTNNSSATIRCQNSKSNAGKIDLTKMEEIFIRFPLISECIMKHLNNKTVSNLNESSKVLRSSIQNGRHFWIRVINNYKQGLRMIQDFERASGAEIPWEASVLHLGNSGKANGQSDSPSSDSPDKGSTDEVANQWEKVMKNLPGNLLRELAIGMTKAYKDLVEVDLPTHLGSSELEILTPFHIISLFNCCSLDLCQHIIIKTVEESPKIGKSNVFCSKFKIL